MDSQAVEWNPESLSSGFGEAGTSDVEASDIKPSPPQSGESAG